MGDVMCSEVHRQGCLYRCRDEICRLLPEHSASLTIGVPNDAPLIYRKDCIR
jgi:hypothetical protein